MNVLNLSITLPLKFLFDTYGPLNQKCFEVPVLNLSFLLHLKSLYDTYRPFSRKKYPVTVIDNNIRN